MNEKRKKAIGYILAFAPIIVWGIISIYLWLSIGKPHGQIRFDSLVLGYLYFCGIWVIFAFFKVIRDKWIDK